MNRNKKSIGTVLSIWNGDKSVDSIRFKKSPVGDLMARPKPEDHSYLKKKTAKKSFFQQKNHNKKPFVLTNFV